MNYLIQKPLIDIAIQYSWRLVIVLYVSVWITDYRFDSTTLLHTFKPLSMKVKG